MTTSLRFISPIQRIEMFLEKYMHFTGPNNEIVFQSDLDISEIKKQLENYDELVNVLAELYALVKGECPSLLNEDSGGDAELDFKIKQVLKR